MSETPNSATRELICGAFNGATAITACAWLLVVQPEGKVSSNRRTGCRKRVPLK